MIDICHELPFSLQSDTYAKILRANAPQAIGRMDVFISEVPRRLGWG
jgi:hypothetical protein